MQQTNKLTHVISNYFFGFSNLISLQSQFCQTRYLHKSFCISCNLHINFSKSLVKSINLHSIVFAMTMTKTKRIIGWWCVVLQCRYHEMRYNFHEIFLYRVSGWYRSYEVSLHCNIPIFFLDICTHSFLQCIIQPMYTVYSFI